VDKQQVGGRWRDVPWASEPMFAFGVMVVADRPIPRSSRTGGRFDTPACRACVEGGRKGSSRLSCVQCLLNNSPRDLGSRDRVCRTPRAFPSVRRAHPAVPRGGPWTGASPGGPNPVCDRIRARGIPSRGDGSVATVRTFKDGCATAESPAPTATTNRSMPSSGEPQCQRRGRGRDGNRSGDRGRWARRIA